MEHSATPYARGRHGRPIERAKAWLKANGDHVCWLCGIGIDMALPYTHAQAWTLDHVIPLSIDPSLALDRSNHREAHRACNSRRGNRPVINNPKGSRRW